MEAGRGKTKDSILPVRLPGSRLPTGGPPDGALPIVGFGRGLGYGAAVWAVADELMVPALGLGPKEAPPKTHVRGLIAHLVYGLALDGMFRTGRRVFA